ncbi:hypothetical protein D9M68_977350 [compost metagenome]
MPDGLGAEGGEQRLIHRAQAPGPEDGDQQLDVARQHARHAIAGTHALSPEKVGETRRLLL